MAGRNGNRRLRLVRKRIRRVPLKKFRRACRVHCQVCKTDHWASAPVEKHIRLKEEVSNECHEPN